MSKVYHFPVLLHESVSGLNIRPEGTYVDVTFGGGGHSKLILEYLGKKGKLYAFDRDLDALKNTLEDERFTLINENFSQMQSELMMRGVYKVDGVLGDFGISSHQIDESSRGFSTRFEANLDMRMNQNEELSAKEILNNYKLEELTQIFKQYGDLQGAYKYATDIVSYRESKEICTTSELKEAIKGLLPAHREQKVLAQLFQALRIEINDELQAIRSLLLQCGQIVKKEGRISMISYHSLEDRLVKRYIREGKFEGYADKDMYGNSHVPFKKTGKLVTPRPSEISDNNRARSAKLRIAEKL